MPRQADIPGQPARHRYQVLLTDDDKDRLDNIIGPASASAYLRGVIQAHLARAYTHTTTHVPDYSVLVAERTINGRTVKTYRCAHCTHTQETDQ